MFFKKKSKRGLKGSAQCTYADGADYTDTQGRYSDADFDEDDFLTMMNFIAMKILAEALAQ